MVEQRLSGWRAAGRIFIGGEDIEKIYPNTEKAKKRLNRDLRKSVRHGNITSIRG